MINLSNTDIVLLSAGMGKRLGKIGTIKPKSLIKINNETLLTRLVKILVLRKATKISVMVGYKSQKIKQELRKIKEVKFKFIKVKNYKTHGHSYTWYLFNKFWNKKKNILLLHTDIIFNENILDNILRSNTKNIIGIKSKKQHLLNPNSFVVQADYKSKIKKIDHLKNLQKYAGEIIGINKISIGTMKLFFKLVAIICFLSYPFNVVVAAHGADKKKDSSTISETRYKKICRWGIFNPPECKKTRVGSTVKKNKNVEINEGNNAKEVTDKMIE